MHRDEFRHISSNYCNRGNDCHHFTPRTTFLCWQSRFPDRSLEQHTDRTIPGFLVMTPLTMVQSGIDESNE